MMFPLVHVPSHPSDTFKPNLANRGSANAGGYNVELLMKLFLVPAFT